jgi:hypothetical protein
MFSILQYLYRIHKFFLLDSFLESLFLCFSLALVYLTNVLDWRLVLLVSLADYCSFFTCPLNPLLYASFVHGRQGLQISMLHQGYYTIVLQPMGVVHKVRQVTFVSI